MKTDHFVLTKNIDLQNESFIIKEGTKLTIRKEGNNYLASFLGINGTYVFNEDEYNDIKGSIKDSTEQKYAIGEEVVYIDNNRNAVIEGVKFMFGQFSYAIRFSDNTTLIVTEDEIRSK